MTGTPGTAGLDLEFVQDDHPFSAATGPVRSRHFQTPPFAQGKLARGTRAAILYLTVDLRRSSTSFVQHVCYHCQRGGLEPD